MNLWILLIVLLVIGLGFLLRLYGNYKWKKFEDEHAHLFGDRNG